MDNLFVFLMIFEYFHVPDEYTERVLTWGLMSALVLRGVMIAIGVHAASCHAIHDRTWHGMA